MKQAICFVLCASGVVAGTSIIGTMWVLVLAKMNHLHNALAAIGAI